MTDTFPPKMPVVAAAAVRRGDELAFARYAYGPWQGQWVFPTGFVDRGEQPDAAAIREVLEEIGLVVEIEGLVSALTMVWDAEPMLYLVFTARYISGEPVADGNEMDAAAFYGLDALDGGDVPFEAQNAFLARRILRGEGNVLLPYASQGWHETYLTTYA